MLLESYERNKRIFREEAQNQNNNLEAKVSELLREQESIDSMPKANDILMKGLDVSSNMEFDKEDLNDEANLTSQNTQNKTNILRRH